MIFYELRKQYLIKNEIFEKNIVLYLADFLQKEN